MSQGLGRPEEERETDRERAGERSEPLPRGSVRFAALYGCGSWHPETVAVTTPEIAVTQTATRTELGTWREAPERDTGAWSERLLALTGLPRGWPRRCARVQGVRGVLSPAVPCSGVSRSPAPLHPTPPSRHSLRSDKNELVGHPRSAHAVREP